MPPPEKVEPLGTSQGQPQDQSHQQQPEQPRPAASTPEPKKEEAKPPQSTTPQPVNNTGVLPKPATPQHATPLAPRQQNTPSGALPPVPGSHSYPRQSTGKAASSAGKTVSSIRAQSPSGSSKKKTAHTSASHVDASHTASTVGVTQKKLKELYKDENKYLMAAVAGDASVFDSMREIDPLLAYGFDKVRDFSGRTVLHLAAWYGHIHVLEALLKPVIDGGASRRPTLKYDALISDNGNSVLHSAAIGGDPQTLLWLLQNARGIEPVANMPNKRGLSPMQAAREVGNQAAADILLRYEPSHLRPVL